MALAMEIRQPSNSKDAKHYDTDRLREEFLIEEIFVPGEIRRITATSTGSSPWATPPRTSLWSWARVSTP